MVYIICIHEILKSKSRDIKMFLGKEKFMIKGGKRILEWLGMEEVLFLRT